MTPMPDWWMFVCSYVAWRLRHLGKKAVLAHHGYMVISGWTESSKEVRRIASVAKELDRILTKTFHDLHRHVRSNITTAWKLHVEVICGPL